MNNSKLYVGHLVQAIPCKGYGFISPKWNDGEDDSDKNIYCYYASNREKARRSCFIKMLDKSKTSLHEEVKNFKGEVLWIATQPQKIFFKVAMQTTESGHKLMAYDLFDERHLSEEEKAEAEANSVVKPSFADVFTVTENGKEIDEKALVEETEAKEETSIVPIEEESTVEPEAEETPVEERKEKISVEEPAEEDEYDSEEDDENYSEEDSSYYEDLADQYGCDDEIVESYKPVRNKKYDDEVVRDKKSQKKASKAKRAQEAEEIEDYFNE